MIDHKVGCPGTPCNCKHPRNGDYVTAEGLEHLANCDTSSWDDGWGACNPSIGKPVACNCIHIDGVWMTRHSEQCLVHPCVACNMRAGKHIAHIHIEGLTTMADDVRVRTCWSCGKQQYMDRRHLWVHVYPAKGCEIEGVQAQEKRPPAHVVYDNTMTPSEEQA